MWSCAVNPIPQTKGYMVFSSSTPEATSMLQVKRFDRDNDYYACRPENIFCTMLHTSVAAMSAPPDLSKCLPEQACSRLCPPSTSRLMASVLGWFTILQSDGWWYDLTVAVNIAKAEVALRKDVSLWPSRCKTRLDHSLYMRPPVLNFNIKSEQWAAMKLLCPRLSNGQTKELQFQPRECHSG